jgi:zinc transporter 9
VLVGALKDAYLQKPKDQNLIAFLRNHNDPFLVTIIVEDSVATFGVLVALVGISLSSFYQNPLFDQISCVTVGLLMGMSAVALASINRQFLLGKSIDLDTQKKIGEIITSRAAIGKQIFIFLFFFFFLFRLESLYNVKSRWEGPVTFGYKAEVDFNGVYFAQLLQARYRVQLRELVAKNEFEQIELLLEQHSEDVTRAIEMEVFQIQKEIRKVVPQCEWIELAPHSVEKRQFLIK